MKLPNSYGSVYKLSGKRRNPWAVRKTVGWKQIPDKKKSYPVYEFLGFYPTRAEALQALAAYNENPYDLHHDTITFAEVYEKWSDGHYKKIKNPNAYKAAYNSCEMLWNMQLSKIKIDHLQQCIDESGKNKPTLISIKALFSSMWNYAVVHEIVPPDKHAMIKYLDVNKSGNPNALARCPFTDKEIDMLWKAHASNEYITIILILIYTGARISELLDLRKEDINLDERYFFIKESKTAAGIREVPIAEKIVPFFEYWMKRNCDHFICTPDNTPFSYRNYHDSYWIPSMIQLGMGNFITSEGKKKPVYQGHLPHDTRHTCVSLLTAAEVDERVIKQIVGHRGEGVTQTVYTHLALPSKLKAINKI